MFTTESVSLDSTVVAQSIYGDMPHLVEPLGLTLSSDIAEELNTFMSDFVSFVQISNVPEKFFRLDLYLEGENVYVIEINVEVADGWGVSLNLLRAADRLLNREVSGLFPKQIPTFPNDLRVVEFELACSEFEEYGHVAKVVFNKSRIFDELDNKIYLTRFSQVWQGDLVKVPKTYSIEVCSWEDVPADVYLKFTDKFCTEAIKSRYSAKPRSELGKARQIKKLYHAGLAIAQERIDSYRLPDNRQVQAVVMCSGANPVTGYIQIAAPERQVINDKDTNKGVLIFDK